MNSYKTFTECQRKYWHSAHMTQHDSDWVRPLHHVFSSIAIKALAEFSYSWRNMRVSRIVELCKSDGVMDEFDQMRIAVAVRSYFSQWPETIGKIDGNRMIVDVDGAPYLLINRFSSQISPSLSAELYSDVTVCGSIIHLREIMDVQGAIVRVVQKNSQVIKQAREFKTREAQRAETPAEFLERANNGKTFEFRASVDELDIAGVEQILSVFELDILMKDGDINQYEQNFGEDNCNCVKNKTKGQACEFYSQCHRENFNFGATEVAESELW